MLKEKMHTACQIMQLHKLYYEAIENWYMVVQAANTNMVDFTELRSHTYCQDNYMYTYLIIFTMAN